MGRKKRRDKFRGFILSCVLILLVGGWLFSAVNGIYRDSGEESRRQLELALRRAAAACYASEGIYPPTLDYLIEHYGVQVGDKYIVYYDAAASNLMPEITVLEKGLQ